MKKLVISGVIIGTILLLASLWNFFSYWSSCSSMKNQALLETKGNLKNSSQKINTLLNNLQKIAVDLTAEFSKNDELRLSPGDRLNEILENNPDISGIGLIGSSEIQLEDFRQNSKNYITRMDKAQLSSSDILSLFQEHIYSTGKNGEKEIAGFVVMDISRQHLQNFLNSMHTVKHGYPFLVSSSGHFICHPSETFIQEKKTIASYAENDKIASLEEMSKAVETLNEGCFDLYSENSGQNIWGMLTPVNWKDWSLAFMVLKEPTLQPSEEQQKKFFKGFIYLILAIITILFLGGLSLSSLIAKRLWLASSLVSLGLAAGICGLWALNISYRQYRPTGETILTDSLVLENYLDNLTYRMVLGGFSKPERIPTGVFLQSIDFETAVNIKITGYVWQKLSVHENPNVSEGIVFPDAQEVEMEKAYERVSGKTRTVGWNFRLVMREGFDYRTYPFDLESVWLRMWPKDFDKNVVLVPDHDSYLIDAPEFLPGIDSQLVLPGWKLMQSYFTYLPTSYNTNFGISSYAGLENFPELRFNVIVRREFLDPFISIILPLLVVSVLVFILLITCSRQEEVKELFGFSAGAILSGIAALFFVVIFAQIDLRKNLQVERIMYMDFYYFVIYLVFLLVSINSVLFCSPVQIGLIHYQDNLIPKILYWPLILGTIFCATAIFFCP